MSDKIKAATETTSTPESRATAAEERNGTPRPRPPTVPTQPINQTAQEEAGRDRAEGGGYT